jgi:hypothetical protein
MGGKSVTAYDCVIIMLLSSFLDETHRSRSLGDIVLNPLSHSDEFN